MDNIHTEDWSDMEEEFPWFMDGYDNEGKPSMLLITYFLLM